MGSTTWVLVDPTGEPRRAAGIDGADGEGPGHGATARRVRRVGLFSNNKQNATEIEEAVGAWARQEHGVELRTYLKLNASAPAEPALIDEMAAECDVVVTGSGDCGSCTSATVHDSVALRRRGVAVAMLTSDAFVELARMQGEALGDEELDLLVVRHPIGGITPDELRERQAEAVRGIAPWWERVAGDLVAAP